METKDIIEKIKEARQNTKQRKFSQTFDLIINLKDFDMKNPENKIDEAVILPAGRGKKLKFAAFVDKEMVSKAKESCDFVIQKDEFASYKGNPKKLRKLAREYDFFIAQAEIMPQIAASFGRFLAPLDKMPNPKMGCVVPAAVDLKKVIERLSRTVKIKIKKHPNLQAPVGVESMSDEDIAKNVMAVYNVILSKLSNPNQQIKSVLLKLTMGKKVKVA